MAEQRVVDAVVDAYSFAAPDATIEQVRSGYDQSMSKAPLAERVTAETGVVGGIAGTWFRAGSGRSKAILFLHGGGYLFGSSRSHSVLASHLAAASSAEVFVADYRLAPEHPYPAAVEDALAAVRDLVAGRGASEVVIAGDSAGGGLALATLLAARNAGAPLPAAAVTFSAWADLTQGSVSVTSRSEIDPLMTKEQLDANAAGYLQGQDAANPLVSPALGDLAGLPPLYMQVGTEEILHDDTLRVAELVRAAGGEVTVEIEQGMPHVHQILIGRLPEATQSIGRAGAFIRDLP